MYISRYSRNGSNPNLADATSKQIVLSQQQPAGFSNHKGGNLSFGPDGYLYFGFGDGGDSGDPLNNSQNGQTLLGKMIRIDVSSLPYTIPPTNPFVGTSTLGEIWATGLRNPWRWSFDRITQDLWIADVGQGNWEEINFQPAGNTGGANYGWRCYEGNVVYNDSGCASQSSYDFPVYAYPHSGPNSGCSATGGYVYRGTQYKSLFGKYIFSDYCSGHIWSLDENFNLYDYGAYGFGIASFGEDRYGELYVANVSDGNVYKIATNECQPSAYITNPDISYICNNQVTLNSLTGTGLTYQWLRNNHPIPGATLPTYSPNVASTYQVVVTNASGCKDTSAARSVINNKPAAVVTGDNNFCTGETALLNANQGTGLTYQWKKNNVNISGATLSTYTATLAGNYKVSVTNNLGCTRVSNPFIVTGPPAGGTIINGSTTICAGDSVEIVAKATGTNFTYQWLKNNAPIQSATNQNYYITSSGFYKVSVSNQFGCTKIGSGKTVTVNACAKIAESNSWKRYQLFTIEGKLLSQGTIHSDNYNPTIFIKEKYNELHGVYILKVYDELETNVTSLKVVL
ncbi:MAG TPA: PQQ-dependent sugar dehydrogenase [Bacteroidia bacterium]|nr:PQQ-dependent sugar dehydrogenase [Bacteroidia bacterium]